MPKRNSGKRLEWREERQVWEIVWYEKGRRRRRSSGTADRGEAEGVLAEVIARDQPTGRCDPAERPIESVLSGYMLEHAPHTAAPERIGYAVSALLTYWDGKTVGDVTGSTCREYARKRKVGDGTVRRELTTLRAAINHDYREGRLRHVVGVVLPKRPPAKERWCDRAEIARLVRAARRQPRARHYLPAFILLAFYTGQRKGAVLDLRKPQVDPARWLIDFNPPGRTQTIKRRPKVPAPRKLRTTLRWLMKRTSDTGFLISRKRRPMHDIQTSFDNAVRDAGLQDVTPHTLRHSAATHMLRRGVGQGKAAKYLGTTEEMVERVYGHHAPGYLDEAAKAFE